MSQLQKIIYLNRQQYETLLSNNNTGQVTYGGITLTGVQDNNIYFITDETVSAADLGDDFILPVTKGGTGKTSFTAGSVLVGNGQAALTELPATNQNTANTLVKRDGSGNFSAGTITAALSGNATTMDYPSGFTSKATSATWGNTTGTFVTSWVAPNSSAIAFMRDNPSSGKLSVKVDGRYYFNEGATPAAGLKSANSYWGMTDPDGTDSVWIRTTTQGIIPYQSGGANAGHCQLGTDTWYFSKGYIQNIYGTLNGTATKATQDSDGNAINTTYLKLSGGTMTGGITLPSKDTAFNTYNLVFSSGGIIGGNTSGNIGIYAGTIYLRGGSNNTTNSGQGITVTGTQVDPYETNAVSLGTLSLKYKNIYATTFTGNLTGNVTGDVTGNADTATSATNDSDGNAINTTYVKKVTSTDNAIARFDGTDGQIQDSTVKITDKGTLYVNPTTANNFNEGIRVNRANDGWAEIILGGANDSASGTGSKVWLLGRRGTAGTYGAIGDFTIEENSSTGLGLTLHQSAGGATLYVSKANDFGLKIINAGTVAANTSFVPVRALTANMEAASYSIINIGQAMNNKNSAIFGFYYAGDASDNNYATIGLHSNNDLIKIFPTGKVNITKNITSSSTTTGSLVVAGGTGIAGALYVGGTANIKQITITDTGVNNHLNFSRTGVSTPNYINIPASSALGISVGGASGANIQLTIVDGEVRPWVDNDVTLGNSSINWKSVHAKKYVVDENVTLQWNSTDSSLDFVFT